MAGRRARESSRRDQRHRPGRVGKRRCALTPPHCEGAGLRPDHSGDPRWRTTPSVQHRVVGEHAAAFVVDPRRTGTATLRGSRAHQPHLLHVRHALRVARANRHRDPDSEEVRQRAPPHLLPHPGRRRRAQPGSQPQGAGKRRGEREPLPRGTSKAACRRRVCLHRDRHRKDGR